MNKLISTVILATFTAVSSFGCVADGSDNKKKEAVRKDSAPTTSNKVEHKKKETTHKESPPPPADTTKKEENKYEAKPETTSDQDAEIMREKSLSERNEQYRDQEIMNKKPYKQ
jgi:hypothetical protein